MPICDDDSQYLVSLYGNWRPHLSSENPRKKTRVTNKDDGSRRNATNVTAVTEESAKAAVLEDPISYHDVLSWDDQEIWEEACRSELETSKKWKFLRK